MSEILIGVDGGGTRTTVVVADEDGIELGRRSGPAGLVDPRRPVTAAETVAELVRALVSEAGISHRPSCLCAGLAGVGNESERVAVEVALSDSGVADRVRVVSDGEIALEGALGGGPGILLVAGTGSVAYGRGEDGRLERTGGWGLVLGDEGSGYALGRAGLSAALRAADGRGAPTRLLEDFLEHLEISTPDEIPPWVGRSEKARVAALAAQVLQAAEEGDEVASRIAVSQAEELARHASSLRRRLRPWSAAVPVVFHGGALGRPCYADLTRRALARTPGDFRVDPPAADAVAGAIRFARALLD